MKEAELIELRQKEAEYLKRWADAGKKITSYECAHCQATIQTTQPRKSDVTGKGYWDSLKTCTACGATNFVSVFPDGRTNVRKGPECK